MIARTHFVWSWTVRISVIVIFNSVSCIEPINLKVRSEAGSLVIDGSITDREGPYTVKLSRSQPIESFVYGVVPEESATIFLDGSDGESEQLVEVKPGEYQTREDGLQAQPGVQYRIRVETVGNQQYETAFQELKPAGIIDSFYYKLVTRTVPNEIGNDSFIHTFDLFADLTVDNSSPGYFYARWTGAYEKHTFPKYITRIYSDPDLVAIVGLNALPDPPPCSGFIFNKTAFIESGLLYYQISPVCTCCVCWINEPDDDPLLLTNRYNHQYTRMALGSISADVDEPFLYKYRVELELQRVDEEIYKFWTDVSKQKSNDIFVPATTRAEGNIIAVNGSPRAFGIFRVGAVTKKSFDITFDKLPPHVLPDPDTLAADCTKFRFSTNQKPEDWD